VIQEKIWISQFHASMLMKQRNQVFS